MKRENLAGASTTALRWVVGWTYFSAFWRRLVLENKLDETAAGYVGEKFNHFLPHALGIRPLIEFFVTHPEWLWWKMMIFTLVECVVGLGLLLGLFTRLMSLGVSALALGILLGSGWLGTTCLDEWQIGVLGVAAGVTLFFTGAGPWSMDAVLAKRCCGGWGSKWLDWFGSGSLGDGWNKFVALVAGAVLLGLTLVTNQVFHGGVYGKLHNLSVKPHVVIDEGCLRQGKLSFRVFRDEGADVYGSFLIGVRVVDERGDVLFARDAKELAEMKLAQIDNEYIAKVKAGAHSLILPLGARATLHFAANGVAERIGEKGTATVILTDISGAEWSAPLLR